MYRQKSWTLEGSFDARGNLLPQSAATRENRLQNLCFSVGISTTLSMIFIFCGWKSSFVVFSSLILLAFTIIVAIVGYRQIRREYSNIARAENESDSDETDLENGDDENFSTSSSSDENGNTSDDEGTVDLFADETNHYIVQPLYPSNQLQQFPPKNININTTWEIGHLIKQ